MAGEYVPMSQRTPEQQEAYRRSCRERNRRYYSRKRKQKAEAIRLQESTVRYGTVPCVKCNEQVIPVCGFCKDGLS